LSTQIRSRIKHPLLSLTYVLSLERIEVYNKKPLPTQPLTKITSYMLKRFTFMISRASEIKVRAKEALPINLHPKNYIRILQ